jgi:hypothetical protein
MKACTSSVTALAFLALAAPVAQASIPYEGAWQTSIQTGTLTKRVPSTRVSISKPRSVIASALSGTFPALVAKMTTGYVGG